MSMESPPPAREATAFAAPAAPVPVARSRDVSRRTRTYVISMSIRMVCLAAMIVVPGAWKLVMLGAAVILPLFAVLVANDQEVVRAPEPHAPVLRITSSGEPALIVDEDGTVHDSPDLPHTP